MNQDTLGWERNLEPGEVLKWAGQPSLSELQWRMFLFVSLVALLSIIPARNIFTFENIDEACGADARAKCHMFYYLRFPVLLFLWGVGLFAFAEYKLQSTGRMQRFFAFTNRRALYRVEGMFTKFVAVNYKPTELGEFPFGELRIGDRRRPKLRFLGLSEVDRKAAMSAVAS